MDSGLEKFEIYEKLEVDTVSNYFVNRPCSSIRIIYVSGAHYVIYTVEITGEEAAFMMLSIPNIDIKKCGAKVNKQ